MILKQLNETFAHQASAIAAGLAALFASACGPPPPDLCTADRKAVCEKLNTQCSTFTCAPDTGSCKGVDKPDNDKCDDDDKCTKDDACLAGKCKGGGEVDKSDGNICTEDKCDAKIGVTYPPNTEPCDDADACTDKDKCKEGKCAGLAKDCNDNNPCTEDEKCNKASGKCANEAKDATCSDSDACTKDDKCVGGKCEGKPETTDDKDPCTKDACDPKAGFSHVPIPDAPCDDGDVCTESDKCDALGKCKPGKKVEIDDNEPCTKDGCDSKTGPTHAPMQGEPCDDKDACTEGDKCSASGKCLAGTAIKAEDGNPCTKDFCDKVKGPQNTPDDSAAYDDGDACTVGDKCIGGKGQPGAKPGCPDKDGDTCTIDQCDPKAGCVAVKAADGTPCKDGNECTDNDSCLAAVCKPGPEKKCTADGKQCQLPACDKSIGCTLVKASDGTDCSDDNKCTDTDKCLSGACAPGLKVECNDGNPCTKDSCDPKLGCVHDAKSLNGSVCDDKTACTQNEVCTNGACVPPTPAKSCDDGNECTSENCDPLTGKCNGFNAKDGTVCDDGDKCTGASFCDIGKCIGKSPVVCKDDGNECTDDACDKFVGCAYSSLEDKPCTGDDNVCTPDSCKAAKCVVGPIKSCDDKNPCTEDSCDKVKGCLNLPADGLTCDDGLVCTVEDKCKGGKCVDVKAKNCADANTCTEDKCDAAKGCLNPMALDGSACDDGIVCTAQDICGSGVCKAGGAKLWTLVAGGGFGDDIRSVAASAAGGVVAVGHLSYSESAFSARMLARTEDNKSLFDIDFKDNKSFPEAGPQSRLDAIAAVPSGGYIAVGASSFTPDWTKSKGYLVRVTNKGEKVCEHQHGTVGKSLMQGLAVSADASFVTAGWSEEAPGFPVGRIAGWNSACESTFDTIVPKPAGDYSHSTCSTIAAAVSGGGYWVACYWWHGSTDGLDLSIQRVQNKQASETYFYKNPKDAFWHVNRLIPHAGGVTAVGMRLLQKGGAWHGTILNLDNNGAQVGNVIDLSGPGNEVIHDAVAAPGGGWFVAGYAGTPPKGMLARVAASGHLQWVSLVSDVDTGWLGLTLTTAGNLGVGGFYGTSGKSAGKNDQFLKICDIYGNCDCVASGTCITKTGTDVDDKNPCTLDWCEAGQDKHAIGNEGLTCDTNKTCQKGVCK